VIEDGTFDRFYFSFVPELLAGATLLVVDADGNIALPPGDKDVPLITVTDASNLVIEFGPGVEVGPGFTYAIGLEAETLFSAAAEILVSGVGPNCVVAPTPTAVPAPTAVHIPNPLPTAVVIHQPTPIVIVAPAPAPAPAPAVKLGSTYGFGSSLPEVHAVADSGKKATALAHTGSDNTYFIYAALSMIAAGSVAMGSRGRRVEIED